MKTTSYKDLCDKEGLEFVKTTRRKTTLGENEYYALMVTDPFGETNPHVQGVDVFTHQYLVGIERPSGKKGCYISKDFNKRRNGYRGTTFVVKTDNPENYTEL